MIFGASGFTGKYVVREILKFLKRPDGKPPIRVALAGRSTSKLAATLAWASSPQTPPPLPLLQAHVDDPASLLSMCRCTKLLLNCVGPYRLYGAPVVHACIESGIDYLDITGEPEFMEKMELLHHQQAVEQGSLVVSACGYDSIPAELGLLHHLRHWEAPALPNSVSCFLELRSRMRIVGNLGTWESAVLGIANAAELRKVREKRKKAGAMARVKVPGAPFKKPSLISRQKDLNMWAVLLPSADAAVVRRTMATIAAGGPPSIAEEEEDGLSSMALPRKLLYTPVHFSVFSAVPSMFSLIAQIWTGLSLLLLSMFAFGRRLLLKFPAFFSLGLFRRGGPSEAQVAAASFNFWFIGKGYSDSTLATSTPPPPPDVQVTTLVSGPEIGYITTPICLVQCALLVLDNRRALPRGGVYTPGIVFGSTDLQDRLQANGISFEFVSKGSSKRNAG